MLDGIIASQMLAYFFVDKYNLMYENTFMSRFPLESAADLATNYARHMARIWGDDPTASVAVNICENCGKSCETLHHVREFDYMGCDTCLDEAMAVLAAEASANWLQAAVAANVRKPSAATRELVLFMLESRERARRIITPAQT
jgi:hypothetical protein